MCYFSNLLNYPFVVLIIVDIVDIVDIVVFGGDGGQAMTGFILLIGEKELCVFSYFIHCMLDVRTNYNSHTHCFRL